MLFLVVFRTPYMPSRSASYISPLEFTIFNFSHTSYTHQAPNESGLDYLWRMSTGVDRLSSAIWGQWHMSCTSQYHTIWRETIREAAAPDWAMHYEKYNFVWRYGPRICLRMDFATAMLCKVLRWLILFSFLRHEHLPYSIQLT